MRHILVINRWSAPLAAFEALLGGSCRISYVTTPEGLSENMMGHAAAIEVVDDPSDLRGLVNACCRIVAMARTIERVVALAPEDVLAAAELRQLLEVPGETAGQVLAWKDKREMRWRLKVHGVPVTAGLATVGANNVLVEVDALVASGVVLGAFVAGATSDAAWSESEGRADPDMMPVTPAPRDLAALVAAAATALGIRDQALRIAVLIDAEGTAAIADVEAGVRRFAFAAAAARIQAFGDSTTSSATASVSAATAASTSAPPGASMRSSSPVATAHDDGEPCTVTPIFPERP